MILNELEITWNYHTGSEMLFRLAPFFLELFKVHGCVKKTESVLESENANLGMASKNGLLVKECRYGIMEMGVWG